MKRTYSILTDFPVFKSGYCFKIFYLPLIVFFFALSSVAGADTDFTGQEIIGKYLAAQEVASEVAILDMKMEKSGKPAETYRFLALYKQLESGGSSYLMRIRSPETVANVTLLTIEDTNGHARQYVYLPAVGKTRRLKRDSQRNPFLGSDFSYEDLLREIPSTQTYKRLPDQSISGQSCFVIEAVENMRRTRDGYHHRTLFIEKAGMRLLRIDFYNSPVEKIKTLQASDYESSEVKGNTVRPRIAVMKNVTTGTTTTFTVSEGYLNHSINDDLFSPRKVENWPEEEIAAFMAQLASDDMAAD